MDKELGEVIRKYMLHAQLDLLPVVKFIEEIPEGGMEVYKLPDVNGVKETIEELQQFTGDRFVKDRIAEWRKE
jgi:hypothetical protein